MIELTRGKRPHGSAAVSSRAQAAPGLALALAVGVAILGVAGCRSRAEQSKTAAAVASATPPSDASSTIVESKNLANRDEAFDLPFAEEKTQTFKVSPGTVVKILRINGKVTIERSTTEDVELSIVRSVDEREDMKDRKLTIEQESDELNIRMERRQRSAMFSMFDERGREKQRMVLKLPHKVDLELVGVSGRIDVVALDGDLSIESCNAKVALAQISGSTAVAGLNGSFRIVADAKNRKDLNVVDVNGSVEVFLAGDVNADIRIVDVRGRVDQDLPNLVFDGERRHNDFKARVGKGGAMIAISDVNGRVRLAPASKQDAQPVATASAK